MSERNGKMYMSYGETSSMNNHHYRTRGNFNRRYQPRRNNYNSNDNSYYYESTNRNRYNNNQSYGSRRGISQRRRGGGFESYRQRYRPTYRTNYKKKNTYYRSNYNNKQQNASENQSESRTRLLVSNLHNSVVNTELKKIFDSIGPLKRCGIRWDKLGNSLGTADVEYDSPLDAAQAIKTLNNAEIEGVMMKVEYNSERSVGPQKRIFKKRLGYRRNNTTTRNDY